jgi:RNase P/RNase MRP subunit p29
MSLIGKTVSLIPTQGAYQKPFNGRVVHETATQFAVESESFIGRRKFRKSDGMPVAKADQAFPRYRAVGEQ